MLVHDDSLDHQHSTVRKFSQRWFGPYVVTKVNQNSTYGLRELDGTHLKLPIAGKRVKIFHQRTARFEVFEQETLCEEKKKD